MLHAAWLTPKLVAWVVGGLLGLVLLRALGYRFSRVVGLIVLAGQLPGDVAGFLDDFFADPRATWRSLSSADVWGFISAAIIAPRKMRVRGTDVCLDRLDRIRAKYEQEGWERVAITTADGVRLDGALVRPPAGAAAQRWVVFFNANMQKYEEWLFYFHRYAKDAQVGMLVFNWRGVGFSDGCAVSVADLVADGTAAVGHVRALGVAPGHVLVHGLSIGACVAALVRARAPRAEHGPVCLDRGFVTLSAVLQGYVEFAMRGGRRTEEGWRSGVARGLKRAVLEALALLVWLILLATGWEADTLSSLRKLHAPSVVIYHARDNIIEFKRASLYAALVKLRASGALGAPAGPAGRAPGAPPPPRVRWHAVQLRTAHAEWQPHDAPLYLDDEWAELLRLLAAAFDAGDGDARPSGADGKPAAGAAAESGEPPAATVGERARALVGLASGSRVADGADGMYTRML